MGDTCLVIFREKLGTKHIARPYISPTVMKKWIVTIVKIKLKKKIKTRKKENWISCQIDQEK